MTTDVKCLPKKCYHLLDMVGWFTVFKGVEHVHFKNEFFT